MGVSEQPNQEVSQHPASPDDDLPDLEFWPSLDFDPDLMQSFDWIDAAALGQQNLAQTGAVQASLAAPQVLLDEPGMMGPDPHSNAGQGFPQAENGGPATHDPSGLPFPLPADQDVVRPWLTNISPCTAPEYVVKCPFECVICCCIDAVCASTWDEQPIQRCSRRHRADESVVCRGQSWSFYDTP